MRPRALALVASLLLLGCRSSAPSAPPEDDDEARIVERPAPPEPVRPRRFELVETAVLASSTALRGEVTISLPIASTDPGVQDVDSLLVRITPDRAYNVVEDTQGNRRIVVHTNGDESVSCELTYHVERRAVKVDLSREEARPLSEIERKLFAAELAPISSHAAAGPDSRRGKRADLLRFEVSVERPVYGASPVELLLDDVRLSDTPARRIEGLVLSDTDRVREEGWFEAFVPGAGWVPFQSHGFLAELAADRITLSHGLGTSVPAATSAGKSLPLEVTYRWREAP